MSIDAVITKVKPIEYRRLRIDLGPRTDDDGVISVPGQSKLFISVRGSTHPPHVPAVGQAVWGGSGSVIIEPSHGIDVRMTYIRDGALNIIEQPEVT